jgi:UDP-N-acetylglucosamine transferase subunit ALG13
MIFVTVGAQMPFDRLVRAVDEWAGDSRRGDVFAQIGPSGYRPRHLQYAQFINPLQYEDAVTLADVIVSHAGMGTIITALERGKPILVMPRRGDLGETRNDHQVATARCLEGMKLVHVAMDPAALAARLDAIDEIAQAPLAGGTSAGCAWCRAGRPGAGGHPRPGGWACPHLLSALRGFLSGEPCHPGAGGPDRVIVSPAEAPVCPPRISHV